MPGKFLVKAVDMVVKPQSYCQWATRLHSQSKRCRRHDQCASAGPHNRAGIRGRGSQCRKESRAESCCQRVHRLNSLLSRGEIQVGLKAPDGTVAETALVERLERIGKALVISYTYDRLTIMGMRTRSRRLPMRFESASLT
jgi:hypothetical protein